MTKSKKKSAESGSPRIAHVDFYVDKEKRFKAYVNYLSNPWHVAWRNFLAGSFHGVGFILGTALFLTVAGWVLNGVLGEIPFFSDVTQAINVWLESTLENQ